MDIISILQSFVKFRVGCGKSPRKSRYRLELALQTDAERAALDSLIVALEGMSDDPKLRAIRYYLKDEGWLELGCIIFSQYYYTARWVADSLAARNSRFMQTDSYRRMPRAKMSDLRSRVLPRVCSGDM